MADVNVSVVTVDSGIDCFEKIQEAVDNYQIAVLANLKNVGDVLEEKIDRLERKISRQHDLLLSADTGDESSSIETEISKLEEEVEKFQSLKSRQFWLEQDYKERSGTLLVIINDLVSGGKRDMADYLQHILGIAGGSDCITPSTNVFSGESNYIVVFIDRNKYPESAEHIEEAIRAGHPAILTLNRPLSDENRKKSLKDFPRRSGFDRDEYPPACFSEGGQGAHVVYMSPSDNRGSGKTWGLQLHPFPDGTRVRFRVRG